MGNHRQLTGTSPSCGCCCGCREIQYEKVWPEEGPSILPRKGVFTLQFRSLDAWPLSITWAIADSSSETGHLSLLSAALTPTMGRMETESYAQPVADWHPGKHA